MLGSGYLNNKSNRHQRRRINITTVSEMDTIIKENIRNKKMMLLANKYFNRITKHIIQAIMNNKNSINFYYNYYDFVNNGLGKPHGFLNEFLMEMSYEYSQYVTKDCHDNPMTFKTLFGDNFRWEIKGKNNIIFYW
tara:strand:- start:5241 stop:5648 length:408 start_codon:yes stop_codon:yes gene_type:complete